MIIADTNVVSEFMRDQPDPHVLGWAQRLGPTEVTICVVTVEEIERGLGSLPAGRRRTALDQRWQQLLRRFTEGIATYDVPAAQATAHVLVEAAGSGHPMALADAQIAGICLARGDQLATRNTKDFGHIRGLNLVNPFA